MWTPLKALRYVLFSASALLFTNALQAQNITDSVRTNGFRIGIDVIKLITSATNTSNFQLEFMGQYNADKHLILSEIGLANKTSNVGNYAEKSKGAYIRLGYERNFLKKGNDIFGLGGRISGSFFQHQASDLQLGDVYWGQLTSTLPATNDYIIWLEASSSIKVDISPYIGLGFTVRLQRKLITSYDNNYEPAYIPGYGATNTTFTSVLNYFVYFAIPVKRFRISQSELSPKK